MTARERAARLAAMDPFQARVHELIVVDDLGIGEAIVRARREFGIETRDLHYHPVQHRIGEYHP